MVEKIDKETLERYIELSNNPYDPIVHDDDMQIVEHLADTVEQLQQEVERLREQLRWIPVEERLPDHYDDVLVICKDGECWATHHEYGQWWKTGVDELQDVTHWMPLPEPPKITSDYESKERE